MDNTGQGAVTARASADEENKATALFMDTVGEDLLHNIMRLLSDTPNNPAWAQGIPEHQIEKIYRLKGAIYTWVRKCFDEICVRD